MAQVEQCRDLPEEDWKEVLSKLWLNEEDLEHVLICRKVCSLWEKLVDEMPTKPYWNPWHKNRLDENNTVGYSIATIINSDLSIRKFLSGGFELEKNPFRNHTLSVFLKYIRKKENLLKIIEDHGQHVTKFLFHPAEDVGERLTNIQQLLEHMKNIRTLVLDCSYLSMRQLMAMDGKNFPKDLNKLNELVLRREVIFCDMNDDDRMYAKLSINYGSQIKSLTLDTGILNLNRSKIMEKFPNLEDLSIGCAYIQSDFLVPPAAKPWPKLKRLALSTSWVSIPDNNILRVSAGFAETLELLSLGTDKEFGKDIGMKKAIFERNQGHGAEVITTFPKLTQLILPFRFMRLQVKPINIPLETIFPFSFPNLKLLVLEDVKDELKNRGIGGAKLEEICAPFWPLVPSSVETISIRSEKTNQVLHLDFPVVYKCKRNQVA